MTPPPVLLITAAAIGVVASGCAGSDPSSESGYVDGDYRAMGWYGGLPSHIEVELTLEHGVITAVEVTPTATNAISLDLQERFAQAVPDVVIGRSISDLEVDRLAGSSGTPVGFNDAFDKIRDQATP